MKTLVIVAAAVALASCGSRTGCKTVTDQIFRCVTYDEERGRLDVVYATRRYRTTPSRDRLKSLERGFTGGPAVVAVDSCGARDRVYIVQGLFDIGATSFDVVDLSGTYGVGEHGMDQDVARVRRDSLRASGSRCLVWSER